MLDKCLKSILFGIPVGILLKIAWEQGLIQRLVQFLLANRGPVFVLVVIVAVVVIVLSTSADARHTIAIDLKTIIALTLSLTFSLSFAFNSSFFLSFFANWNWHIPGINSGPSSPSFQPLPTPIYGPYAPNTWPFYNTPSPTTPPTDTPTPTPTLQATETITPTVPAGYPAATPTSPADVTPAPTPIL